MQNSHDFELLLVKDQGNFWEVIGITYSNAMLVEPDCSTLRATLFAIEDCKKALHDGKRITISKVLEFSEVQPNDLIINDVNELERIKLVALNEVSARMQHLILTVSIIDAMDFMQTYMQLLNAGIFITDSNREDKYLEIIEKSQEIEEPTQLSQDASFEQEQEYITNKKLFDDAQTNLATLEKYLNAYDKLFKVKYVYDTLNAVKIDIENATDSNTISKIMAEYNKKIDAFK